MHIILLVIAAFAIWYFVLPLLIVVFCMPLDVMAGGRNR